MHVLNAEARPICRNFRAREPVLLVFSPLRNCSLYAIAPRMAAIMVFLSLSFTRFIFDCVYVIVYASARVDGGWTCANIGRCRMQRRVTREAGRNERQGEYMRGKNVATLFLSLGRCFFALECLRVHGGLDERGGGNDGAPGSSPLGRSCVNPLREAHTKLVSLSFSLSLLSPCSSFPSKGCRDCPYKPLAACSVSPIRVFSESSLIRRFYELRR